MQNARLLTNLSARLLAMGLIGCANAPAGGLYFEARPETIGRTYLRAFQHDGITYALAGESGIALSELHPR
jgi:hypothetical protein